MAKWTIPSLSSLATFFLCASAAPTYDHILDRDASAQSANTNITCPKGVHILAARGTESPPGDGRLLPVVEGTLEGIPNSIQTALVYPADAGADPLIYPESEQTGRKNMISDIESYVKACGESSKLVLMGYSQGAQVVGDTLCGTDDGGEFPVDVRSRALDSKYYKNIVAVIMMGDPTHNTTEKFVYGTSDHNGILVRKNVEACQPFSERIRSYCDLGDPFCNGRKNSKDGVHGTYAQRYGKNAIDFVLEKYKLHQ